jgi:hypothetical protein
MHSGFTAPIEIHDVPVINELLHHVVTICGGVRGFDQIAVHG